MDTSGLPGIPVIKSELIPPLDPVTGNPAEPTGKVFKDGQGNSHMIYEMNFVDLAATVKNKQPVMDPDTDKQLVRKGGEGGPYKVYHNETVFVFDEFILERGDIGERDGAHDLSARVHDGERAGEDAALRDPALGHLHALERLV